MTTISSNAGKPAVSIPFVNSILFLGKSSLINSLQMALHQEWKDRAKYNPGKNHTIDQCVLFNNRCQRKGGGGKVVFWDTRGFEEVHSDDRAVLILRYILEGRIPPKCIPCVLLMDKDLIKKRYQKVLTSERRIDLVLSVSAFVDEPQTKLMSLVQQAISSSKLEGVKSKRKVCFYFKDIRFRKIL